MTAAARASSPCNIVLRLEVRRKLNRNDRKQDQHDEPIQPSAADVFLDEHVHPHRSRHGFQSTRRIPRHVRTPRPAHQEYVIIMTHFARSGDSSVWHWLRQ